MKGQFTTRHNTPTIPRRQTANATRIKLIITMLLCYIEQAHILLLLLYTHITVSCTGQLAERDLHQLWKHQRTTSVDGGTSQNIILKLPML